MAAILHFEIQGGAAPRLRAYAVDGTEALSTLYAFDIDCLADPDARIEPLDLVGSRATLRIELEGAAPRVITGVVETIEVAPPALYGDVRLRVRLVPWLARLRLSRSNQVHGTTGAVSVAEVLAAELSGALRREAQIADADPRVFEHELRLMRSGSYPKRDHICQYEETDFDFVSRLAEHWGIFYFFEPAGEREKVVFTDDVLLATPLEGDPTLAWQPWRAGARQAAPDTVQELVSRTGPVPQKVWVQDHNYRAPHVPLLASAEVDPRGRGNWVEFGTHHRTPDEGSFLAAIRAEELLCRQQRWHGASAVPRLAPGRRFGLRGHPYDAWNQDYLIVAVRHEVRVPVPGLDVGDWAGYRNRFEAIPAKVKFRPARVTPKPRMDGLLNGRVDGAGDRGRAEIDDQGRYKVRVPFDMAGTPDGQGSQWVRMASPFGGDGDGMHFPLFPDTEVVLGCVNGDPDRPVILGAVPNPRNRSVVVQGNAMANRLVTRSGGGFEIGVAGGGGGGGQGGGGSGGGLATQNAYGPSPVVPDALGATPRTVPAAPLATPDALSATSEFGGAGAQNTYGRLYVQANVATVVDDPNNPGHKITTNAPGAITDTLRLGTKPPASSTAALTDEPASLSSPGSLGYSAASFGFSSKSGTTSFDNPPARTDTLFNDESGIYEYTTGNKVSRIGGAIGVTAKEDVILMAGVGTEASSRSTGAASVDISATKQIRLYSAAETAIFAGSALKINSQSDITIEAKGKVSTRAHLDTTYEAIGNYTVTNFKNKVNMTWGLQTDFYMGMRNQLNLGVFTTTNLNAQFTTTLGYQNTIFLGAQTTFTFAARFAAAFGANKTVNMGATLATTWGLATGLFFGGRVTKITGIEAKWATLDISKAELKLDAAAADFEDKLAIGLSNALSAQNKTLETAIYKGAALFT